MRIDGKKIAVLMGGVSNEREVSLRSGRNVVNALKEGGLNVFAIDVQDEKGVFLEKELREKSIDVAFIALHGRYGEDGGIQGLLEKLSIPYTGSGIVASAGCFNKYAAKQLFEHAGISTPMFRIANVQQRGKGALDGLEFPVVVKPCSGGSAIGVAICRENNSFEKAIDEALEEDNLVLIEKYITGREVTLSVIGSRVPEALPVIEILPVGQFYDYRAKYEKGMSRHIVPARLSPEQKEKVEEKGLLAYGILGCQCFARVDMILGDDGEVYILEVNTIPGLTETSLFPEAARARGLSFGVLCLRLLEMVDK